MKRTLSGMMAYAEMLSAKVPTTTRTYKPISHAFVINTVRSEITNAGYVITGEEFKVSNDGKVALGSFKINYGEDEDIELTATFRNTYTKQQAFKFMLTASIKGGGAMFMKDIKTYDSTILKEGVIRTVLKESDELYTSMCLEKDTLKKMKIGTSETFNIMGKLFMEYNILTTMQLNMIRTSLRSLNSTDVENAWAIYKCFSEALQEAHPTEFIEMSIKTHQTFEDIIKIEENSVLDKLDDYFAKPSRTYNSSSTDPTTLTYIGDVNTTHIGVDHSRFMKSPAEVHTITSEIENTNPF